MKKLMVVAAVVAAAITILPARGDTYTVNAGDTQTLDSVTSGGGLLANWTVTLNGQAVETTVVNGMEIRTKKDATGLWLKVDKPGVAFIIR